ncbi:uncharacterized membrane protein (DUF485 family) [Brevundimonas alba]|uniref:Uncharacterized membrane protein (DUF485 family) n=1 Tax=Brevundimonas alba TaxID=74314 RepID=A0A7X5YMG1_9CAUL|nr:hypothetical protein [Brevundimonas alba]NJC41334.1 uncharacterized membrane protein (DUF485 family) [Brevundimonas alba]
MTGSTRGSTGRAILLATLAAGALDICAAILLNLRVGPLIVLQSVAGGWMGTEAYRGGWTTGLLGLAAHFGIMLVIAAVYMTLAARTEALRRQWIAAGVIWGALVWTVMTLVVVPMSASPLPIPDALHIVQGLIVHVLMVGLPMAWIARRTFGPSA